MARDAGDRQAGARAQPPAVAVLDVTREEPHPDGVPEARGQDGIREGPEAVAPARCPEADLAAGRAESAAHAKADDARASRSAAPASAVGAASRLRSRTAAPASVAWA